jgi:hypothetical protein
MNVKNYKKGALDSQMIKFTSCLPIVGGSLRELRLLPPLKLVTMILLKVALNTENQSPVSIRHTGKTRQKSALKIRKIISSILANQKLKDVRQGY